MEEKKDIEYESKTTDIDIETSSDDENEKYLVPDYEKEIVEIIRSNITPKLLKEKISCYHESNIANALGMITKEERQKLYNFLDNSVLTSIFEYAEDNIEKYFSELNIKTKIEILSELDVDVATTYLKKLEKGERNMLIDLIDDEAKKEIILLSSFTEDEIGSKMTTNYVKILTGLNAKEATKELIDQAADNDNISKLYIIDENRTFCGAVDLKDLIIARDNVPVEDITTNSYPYVYAHELIEDCMSRIKNTFEDSIPVLNDNNQLIGVITAQDFVQVVDDELGDDYAKLAGLLSEEDLNESIFQSLKKRLPWLIGLLFLGLMVSSVVGLFEEVVAQLTLIICFQSLILDMAGNVGTQSLAVTIRVLMDENLKTKQRIKLIFKEARVGLTNGLILGTLSFLFIGLYIMLIKHKEIGASFAISGCVGIALLVAMLVSSLVGTIIPIIFKKMKVDPAVASGPLITTINDLVAVISYYGLAWILIINVLGITSI